MKNIPSAPPSFSIDRFISFHLSDPGGVLFFGQIFFLCHEAFEQFIDTAMDVSWKNWFQNENRVVPVRHTEASFSRPILAGKSCRIELTIMNVSETAFSISYSFFQEELCCEVSVTHVFCDRLTGKKIPIPQHIKNRFLSFREHQ